jgi:hypothetical protein
MTPAAYAVFSAVRSCWTPEVYIAELGHRFWRLTLQVMRIIFCLVKHIQTSPPDLKQIQNPS